MSGENEDLCFNIVITGDYNNSNIILESEYGNISEGTTIIQGADGSNIDLTEIEQSIAANATAIQENTAAHQANAAAHQANAAAHQANATAIQANSSLISNLSGIVNFNVQQLLNLEPYSSLSLTLTINGYDTVGDDWNSEVLLLTSTTDPNLVYRFGADFSFNIPDEPSGVGFSETITVVPGIYEVSVLGPWTNEMYWAFFINGVFIHGGNGAAGVMESPLLHVGVPLTQTIESLEVKDNQLESFLNQVNVETNSKVDSNKADILELQSSVYSSNPTRAILNLNLIDSYGDGWGDIYLTITDANTGNLMGQYRLVDGTSTSIVLDNLFTNTTYNVFCGMFPQTEGGPELAWPGEVSWSITLEDNSVLLSGDAGGPYFPSGGAYNEPPYVPFTGSFNIIQRLDLVQVNQQALNDLSNIDSRVTTLETDMANIKTVVDNNSAILTNFDTVPPVITLVKTQFDISAGLTEADLLNILGLTSFDSVTPANPKATQSLGNLGSCVDLNPGIGKIEFENDICLNVLGSYTLTVIVKESGGLNLESSANVIVNILDDVDPVISGATDLLLSVAEVTDSCNNFLTYADLSSVLRAGINVSDSYSGIDINYGYEGLLLEGGNTQFSEWAGEGTLKVTLSTRDNAGNTTSVLRNVIVYDASFGCIFTSSNLNQVLEADKDGSFNTLPSGNLVNSFVLDSSGVFQLNNGANNFTFSAEPSNVLLNNVGSTDVSLSALYNGAVVAERQFIVTVQDTEAPTFDISTSTINVNFTDLSAGTKVVDLSDQVAQISNLSDNLSDAANINVELLCDLSFDHVLAYGDLATFSWKATDENGNSLTKAATSFAMTDLEAPIAVAPDITNVERRLSPAFTDADASANITASDNQSTNLTTEILTNPVDVTEVGTYTVTFKVTDPCGNFTGGSFNVEVVDTTPPEIVLHVLASQPPIPNYNPLNTTSLFNYLEEGGTLFDLGLYTGLGISMEGSYWSSPEAATGPVSEWVTPSDSMSLVNIPQPRIVQANLTQGFAGAIFNSENSSYLFPSYAQPWAGFANMNTSIYPLTFSNGGKITFYASGDNVDIRFRFEKLPFPDTEPSYDSEVINVTGSGSYTIDIPSQGTNTFSSFLLYVVTRDKEVIISDVKVTESAVLLDTFPVRPEPPNPVIPEPIGPVIFNGGFGGVIFNSGNNSYLFPSSAESWGGFANEDASIYPLTFSNGGKITFDADGDNVDIRFRFERLPFPNTEPSYDSEVINVTGSGSYTIDIPSQGTNTFSSFLLYLVTRDKAVIISNVKVTGSSPLPSPPPFPIFYWDKMYRVPPVLNEHGVLDFTNARARAGIYRIKYSGSDAAGVAAPHKYRAFYIFKDETTPTISGDSVINVELGAMSDASWNAQFVNGGNVSQLTGYYADPSLVISDSNYSDSDISFTTTLDLSGFDWNTRGDSVSEIITVTDPDGNTKDFTRTINVVDTSPFEFELTGDGLNPDYPLIMTKADYNTMPKPPSITEHTANRTPESITVSPTSVLSQGFLQVIVTATDPYNGSNTISAVRHLLIFG